MKRILRRLLLTATVASLLVGCGGKSHHTLAADPGVTRLLAVCREAQRELAGISRRDVEQGAPSEREIERKLSRGGLAALAADFRRRMRGAAQHSVAVLSAASDKIKTLRLAKSDEGEGRTALQNLADHRSLLVEYEHEIHRMSLQGETYGWTLLYYERDVACGPRGGR